MARIAYELVWYAKHFPQQVGVENCTVLAVVFGVEQGFLEEIWLLKTVEVFIG